MDMHGGLWQAFQRQELTVPKQNERVLIQQTRRACSTTGRRICQEIIPLSFSLCRNAWLTPGK